MFNVEHNHLENRINSCLLSLIMLLLYMIISLVPIGHLFKINGCEKHPHIDSDISSMKKVKRKQSCSVK